MECLYLPRQKGVEAVAPAPLDRAVHRICYHLNFRGLHSGFRLASCVGFIFDFCLRVERSVFGQFFLFFGSCSVFRV